jgi:hypothetical protein
MNRDDIIKWAREAGFELNMWQLSVGCEATGTHEELERFAALVAAAAKEEMLMAGNDQWLEEARKTEREACIDDCNAEARDDGTAQRIIERIRVRGRA